MARKPSVVLTPADKKAAFMVAMAAIKTAKASARQIAKNVKAVLKARASEDKITAKQVLDNEKALAAAQAKLEALTAPAEA